MADCFSPEKRSWVMRQIRGRDTKAEVLLRSLIHRSGYRFRLHRADLPGKPDIVLPGHRVLIYVHGCFWHGHGCRKGRRPKSNSDYWNLKIDRNIARDQKHIRDANLQGWRPLVVWECELRMNSENVLSRVLHHIEADE